jgi:hypothetical protein
VVHEDFSLRLGPERSGDLGVEVLSDEVHYVVGMVRGEEDERWRW